MGNELKLSLHNFQSISDGELIFHPGINVIIGQSNSGKSATFRALKACLSNPAGSQRFIKKGTTNSAVTLEYSGNQIIWKRSPKESTYIINGETFLKTGSSNAFKIIEDTGFVRDENDVIMNIEEELQLPFPFGISKFELFKLYENVFCISDSAVILKAMKENEDSVKSKMSELDLNLTKNKNKLEELKEFKEMVSISTLKQMRDKLKRQRDKLEKLKDGLPVIKKALLVEKIEIPESTFKSKLNDLKEYKQLQKTVYKLKKLHTVGKSLKDTVPTFKHYLEEYTELRVLSKIKDIKIPELAFTSNLEKYTELINYKEFLENLKIKIKEKRANLEDINKLIKKKEEKLKEFKVCPLCHKPLN